LNESLKMQTIFKLSLEKMNFMSLYHQLAQSHHFPFQAQPWWLDAVCGPDGWGAALAFDDNGAAIGTLPFPKNRYNARMPLFTAYFPVWVSDSASRKRERIYHRENLILQNLIGQLPKPWLLDMQFDPGFSNGLPFYEQGFHLSVRYTCLLEELGDIARISREMESATRNHIRRARDIVEIDKAGSLDVLYDLIGHSFGRQGKKTPFSMTQLATADACLAQRGMRSIYVASADGKPHAAVYLVRDLKKTTLLLSGTHPKYRQSGALYLLLWEAIKDAAKYTPTFDFEGSMIPPIERVFRSFGARRVPYLRVTRYQNRLLAAAAALLGKNR
jgi:hypothetical protein